MTAHLTCGAQWCTPCPNSWKEGVVCQVSDIILDAADRYRQEAQAALDWYDLMYPEDFLSSLTTPDGVSGEGQARRCRKHPDLPGQ